MSAGALDCLVIGAGPAGLTAAIYLARFRRRFIVIDGGASRAALIATSHNHAGFPEGVRGTELLKRMSAQALRYGAVIVAGEVEDLAHSSSRTFVARIGRELVHASTVLLATGVVDIEPALPDLRDAVARGLIRHCGICDGYETIGRTVAVIGRGGGGLREALFLRTYSASVALLSLGEALGLSDQERSTARACGIELIEHAVSAIVIESNRISAITFNGWPPRRFDIVYSMLGSKVRSSLAAGLGARLDERDCVLTDAHQATTVDGLYAAGDVVSSLDQISVAMGQAAIAATAIHNRLPRALARVEPDTGEAP